MKKSIVVLVSIGMLCVSISGIATSFGLNEPTSVSSSVISDISQGKNNMIVNLVANDPYLEKDENDANLEPFPFSPVDPISSTDDGIFGWWVRLKYNGKTFEKELDLSIDDFKEKFLKHPEYGEIIYFDIDSDPYNDVEVIVGFYWSIIQDASGSQSKSLEMRFRVRQLEQGGYIDDSDGELEVWSELHVDLSFLKDKAADSSSPSSNVGEGSTSEETTPSENFQLELLSEQQTIGREQNKESSPFLNLLNSILQVFRNSNTNDRSLGETQSASDNFIFGNGIFKRKLLESIELLVTKDDDVSHEETAEKYHPAYSEPTMSSSSDGDYLSIGAGYRSPSGVDIPRFTEKRFAFAKSNLLSPTIFQHEMDPGSSKGKGPIELLYGFQSYEAGGDAPTYDIKFSVEFDPAVYLKTKFVPAGGYVYYYFDQDSQQNSDTEITFSADINKGSGDNAELTLVFDKIDSSLGRSGRWMSFDVDLLGDHKPFGGGFKYRASHKFNVGVIVSVPSFNENYNRIEAKMDIKGIPTSIDVDFDFDIRALLHSSNKLDIDISGDVNLNMNSDLGGITLYYPKSDSKGPDVVLLDVPDGIPSSTKLGAEARAFVDLNDLQASSNFIYGEIYHDCSSNIDKVQVFLPEVKTPVIEVTDIPSYSSARGQLYWNTLQGYAYVSRSSSGRQDPIKIHLEFGDYLIENTLKIRDGHISTSFKVAEDGYFNFDTSKKMFANKLHVVNYKTRDELTLIVDEVSADNLQADWDIDTSGDSLKINNLKFGGVIDTLRGLQLDLKYKGKTTAFNLDWVLGQEGLFDIEFDQGSKTTIDFDLGKDSDMFDLRGSVTLSQKLQFDMSWQFKQGSSTSDPGHFTINEFNDGPNLEHFDLYFTYQDTYGVEIDFYDFKVYLDLEWWKGDRILPYVWLDYEVSVRKLDVDLLWDGEWYYNIEDWTF